MGFITISHHHLGNIFVIVSNRRTSKSKVNKLKAVFLFLGCNDGNGDDLLGQWLNFLNFLGLPGFS